MACKSNNNNTLNKELTNKNRTNCTTGSKFKAVLVKDLLRSFEKPKTVTEDSTRMYKDTSKIDEPYPKIRKHINNEDSSRITSKRLKMANNVSQSISSEMRNPTVNNVPCNCNRVQFFNNAISKSDLDLRNMVGVIQNVIIQLKTVLEQFVQAHEDQTSTLKQILNNVNDINNVMNSSVANNDFFAHDKNVSEVAAHTENSPKTSLKTIPLNLSSPVLCDAKNSSEESINSQGKDEQRWPIPLIKLVSNDDSNQVDKQLSVDHSDLLSKTASESQIDYLSTNTRTPKSAKTLRCRKITAESWQSRRRSFSTHSELDFDRTQGSFTMLERKLNIVYNKIPTNSLLVSPVVSPSTPTFAMQWDKKAKQPLKEYMALKEKSNFLVTPDVNWFQSRLEPTDMDDPEPESASCN